jgi:hypothetical protein
MESDQTLKCRDCQIDFVFTANEQAFFAEKGFRAPSRCRPCRQAKKLRQTENNAVGSGMGGYPTPPEHRPSRRSDRGYRRNNYED